MIMNNKKAFFINILNNIKKIMMKRSTKHIIRYYILIPLLVLIILWEDYPTKKIKDILFDILSILLTVY